MSHQVQLSPAASHCPTAVLDPAGHATDPPACRSRCPYSPGRTCAGYCPTLEIRSARPSLTPPPKIPGRARDRHGRTRPCRSATVRWQARFPRRGKRREDTAGNWRAALRAGPSRQRSASKARGRGRPASYPAGYLPSTSRRPATPPGAGQPQRPRRRIRFCRRASVAGVHAYALIRMFAAVLRQTRQLVNLGGSASRQRAEHRIGIL
jgi:hypothetical protein